MRYRAEIDGLRTVAVLPVIFYHAGLPGFGAGYIGVDIFFVISGFLITTNIAVEIQNGAFKLVHFYERRARRILPALFAILLFCVPAALVVSTKPELENFGRCLSYVSVFLGNVYFWSTASYFDTASDLKPLLHTWSLAVEEQFYLFFPLLLMAGWKRSRKAIVATLVIIAAISFSMSVWGSTRAPTSNFYLLPFRFWELAVGAFAAFWRLRQGAGASRRSVEEFVSIAGLALIAYSLLAYNQDTPFPGVYALAPVCGAALVILFGHQKTWVGRFLSLSPMALIGKISYSAYLWHQPTFAFARQAMIDPPGKAMMFGFSCLSLYLAYLSWRFVEAPFRSRGVSRRMIFIVSAAGIAIFCFAGWGVNAKARSIQLTPLELKMDAFAESRAPSWHTCFLDSSKQPPQAFQPECRAGEAATRKIMVWGDSHTAYLSAGFAPLGVSIIEYTANSCPPIYANVFPAQKYCWPINQYVLSEVERIKPDVVVLDGYWFRYTHRVQEISKTVDEIGRRSPSTHIIVVGSVPLWQGSLPLNLARRKIDLTHEVALPN